MNEEEKERKIPPELPDFENMTTEELASWDKLGFIDIAGGIVKDIERFQPPLIYGVYGNWGSGKTSLLQIVRRLLQKGNYETVWFNPWIYEHAEKDMLFLGLLRAIQHQLYPKSHKWRKFFAGLFAIFRIGVNALLSRVGASTDKIGEYYHQFYKGLSKRQSDVIDVVLESRNRLCKAIEEGLKKKSPKAQKKLVIFIDDLDRCLPDSAILLLDQLKNYLTFPGAPVITVIGVDEDVFATMLDKRYDYSVEQKDKTNFGRKYLEKIIQKPYRLKPKLLRDLMKITSSYSGWFNNYDDIIFITNYWFGKIEVFTPREIDRAMRATISLVNSDQKPGRNLANFFKDLKIGSQDILEWQSFVANVKTVLEGIRNKRTTESVSEASPQEVSQGYAEIIALTVCVWILVILRSKYPDPLNIYNSQVKPYSVDNKPIKLPPSSVINGIYWLFEGWL